MSYLLVVDVDGEPPDHPTHQQGHLCTDTHTHIYHTDTQEVSSGRQGDFTQETSHTEGTSRKGGRGETFTACG